MRINILRVKHYTLHLILASVFCCTCAALNAQTDSSWIDLGRIKLKKEFTQTITVKGEDLEQMPFANLNDALSVWFNGWNEWVAGGSMVYVVDGSVMTDADAYSIYDIKEVTLVQNALVQLNGAIREKQLVLVTTRGKDGPSGLTVAGASSAVTSSSRTFESKTETNFYHQYYLSARQHRDKIQYGITAGYQRDVVPYLKDQYIVRKPYQLNRFRIHGYMNASINRANDIWLRAGYVPGKLTNEWNNPARDNSIARLKTREAFFTTEAGWRSRITKQLTNELTVGYAPATARGDLYWFDINPYVPPAQWDQTETFKNTVNNLLITDHLAYCVNSGNWQVDPSLDLSYRNMYSRFRLESNRYWPATAVRETVVTDDDASDNIFLLTPALSISNKNGFNIQGGFVFNMSRQPDSSNAGTILPFITAGIDVFKLMKTHSALTWSINGSYAVAGHYLDAYYGLYYVSTDPAVDVYPALYNNYNKPSDLVYGGDTHNEMWQVGTSLTTRNSRFQFTYNFERRTYKDRAVYNHRPTPQQPSTSTSVFDNFLNIHRIGIMAKIIGNNNCHWLLGWNASAVETKINHQDGPEGIIRSYNIEDPELLLTSGLVNRLQYKRFMMGVDVLFGIGVKEFLRAYNGNSEGISLRNIYAGYRFQLNNKPFDVYAEARNPGQKRENNFPDRRNYFGLGFKASL